MHKRFAMLFVLSALLTTVGVAQEDGWTILTVGQRLYGIHHEENGDVWIGNSQRKICMPGEVVVSQPSRIKGLAVLICEGDQYPKRGYILDTRHERILYPIASKTITNVEAVLVKWASWSPDERFALLTSSGEGFQGPMILVDLNTGDTKEIDYKRLGLKGETEFLNEESVSWLSGNSFRMRFDIYCQVFSDQPRCAYGRCKGDCDNTIHRSYWARVNLNPLHISYSTGQPATATTRPAIATHRPAATRPPRNARSQGSAANDCKYCGVWKAVVGGRLTARRATDHAGETGNPYCGCDYLRITKVGLGKFKLNMGSEYEGKINWSDDGDIVINNADAIYLRPIGGKLTGRFVSPNFYATHGMDFTYKITGELKHDNELVFSVWCSIRGGETEKATYTKVSE